MRQAGSQARPNSPANEGSNNMENTNTMKGMRANIIGLVQREASVANYYAAKDPATWPNARVRYLEAQASVSILVELADYAGWDIRVKFDDTLSDLPQYVEITVDGEVILEGK